MLESNFQRDLDIGERFQDHVIRALWGDGIFTFSYGSKTFQLNRGEGMALEMKRDNQWPKTQALYLEFQCMTHAGKWKPSGIFRGDRTWLIALGNERRFWLFAQRHLRRLPKVHRLKVVKTERPGDLKSRGYRIPMELAEIYAIRIYEDGKPRQEQIEALVCERCHNLSLDIRGGLCAACNAEVVEEVEP